jgi:hypothetical protein
MFADPFVVHTDWTTVTVDSSEDISFVTTERAADHSTYANPDNNSTDSWSLFIGHQYGRRNRYTARLTVSGLVPDLIIDGNNSQYSQSCYVVFDCPSSGPVNPAIYSDISLPNYMLKTIGGLLISVDSADPLFQRVMRGET